MKKKFLNTTAIGLVIIFFLSGCAEPRYYHRYHRHTPNYYHRHHMTPPPAVEINIHSRG